MNPVQQMIEAESLLSECRDYFMQSPHYDGADTNNLDTRCMDAIAALRTAVQALREVSPCDVPGLCAKMNRKCDMCDPLPADDVSERVRQRPLTDHDRALTGAKLEGPCHE